MRKYINKSLVCIIVFLGLGIICILDNDYKELVNYKLYQDNVSFSQFEKIYNKYLGGIFPLEGMVGSGSQAVFNEDLVYTSSIPYFDGQC